MMCLFKNLPFIVGCTDLSKVNSKICIIMTNRYSYLESLWENAIYVFFPVEMFKTLTNVKNNLRTGISILKLINVKISKLNVEVADRLLSDGIRCFDLASQVPKQHR